MMLLKPIASFWSFPFLMILILIVSSHIHAETEASRETTNGVDIKLQNAIQSLASIQQSIELKQKTVSELKQELKKLDDVSEKLAHEQKIERARKEIADLQLSFEQIALGGVNRTVLAEQPERRIDWRDEIEQISSPLLSTLKELTAKPRQIDGLRREIEQHESQMKVIEKALSSLARFDTQELPPAAANPINQLRIEWVQRRDDSQRALEITRYKLADLKAESVGWQTSTAEALTEFIRGRGLTLFLAIAISLAIWLALKALLKTYWRLLYKARHDIGITRAPLVLYSYRLAVATTIVIAILMVFYVRGDVLLLTLAVIALAGAALSLRQTLPRYAAELRLLLGVGPVREEERLVLDGIPVSVESLGVYTVLRNPDLEGLIRLPLHTMNSLTSRPVGKEPWFPSTPGDYVLLADGNLGKVLRQTIELVEIAVRDCIVQISTNDFLNQNFRNLSRDGYGIASTFGIDYQHQAICLDNVPEVFKQAIITRFEQAGLNKSIKNIIVEFKEAGASSLDYQIYLVLDGNAANAYYKSQRLIQQACVEVCNREGWVIPFTQITVHSSNEAKELLQLEGQTTKVGERVEVNPSSPY